MATTAPRNQIPRKYDNLRRGVGYVEAIQGILCHGCRYTVLLSVFVGLLISWGKLTIIDYFVRNQCDLFKES